MSVSPKRDAQLSAKLFPLQQDIHLSCRLSHTHWLLCEESSACGALKAQTPTPHYQKNNECSILNISAVRAEKAPSCVMLLIQPPNIPSQTFAGYKYCLINQLQNFAV